MKKSSKKQKQNKNKNTVVDLGCLMKYFVLRNFLAQRSILKYDMYYM